MTKRKGSANELNKLYTYNVSFSFNMQFTFPASDVQPSEEGGENDLTPTDEAIKSLEKEVEEYLLQNYPVTDLEAFADFDSLIGVMEVSE